MTSTLPGFSNGRVGNGQFRPLYAEPQTWKFFCGCMITAFFAAVSFCRGGENPVVQMSLLTKNKKVIPLICEYPSLVTMDLKLPDLLVSNSLAVPLDPAHLEIIGMSAGEVLANQHILKEALAKSIVTVNRQFQQLICGLSFDRKSLGLAFGEAEIPRPGLARDVPLQPGECGVILLSRLRHFQFAGEERLDHLQIILTCATEGERVSGHLDVPVVFWQTTNCYRFPVQGTVKVENMALNYAHHRQAHSQEFALDIEQVRADRRGRTATCRKSGSARLADYYIYRQPVLAAAAGVVVETADAYPESQSIPPGYWSPEEANKVVNRLTKAIGTRNSHGGNYIIIRHSPGEFTYYGHLSQHTLKVKVSDRVKAGQPIALVGSTGYSSEPHLHFQLMDAQDVLAANGLPIRFINVPPGAINQYFTRLNSLTGPDCLYLFMPSRKTEAY